MESLSPERSKKLTQLISFLVDFSFQNLAIFENLDKNSQFSELLQNINDSFFLIRKDEGVSNAATNSNSTISELLTFMFLAYYIQSEVEKYEDLISIMLSSEDCIVNEVFKNYPHELNKKFFDLLHFSTLFTFLKEKFAFDEYFVKEDPFKEIYELFLLKYNKKQHKKTGSYFSPASAISFIVSSIEDLLSKYAIHGQLQNKKIIIMDPSCGTGSFLLEISKTLYNIEQNYTIQNFNSDIIGFDINIVSFMLTNQNFILAASKQKYLSSSKINKQVFAINPLVNLQKVAESKKYSKFILEQINAVKKYRNARNTFQIIIGNPPYSAVSNNSNEWINNLLKGVNLDENTPTHNYFEVEGKSINEKKSGWLYDDYNKFLRLGHFLIDQAEGGVLSFISNNAFLSNPSFRGMRYQLLQTFDEIFILDLHGNKLVDTPPQNISDQNIFNIIQGICIFIFIKNLPSVSVNHDKKFSYFEIWGSKEKKLSFLKNNTYATIDWKTFLPQKPFYTFLPENLDVKNIYMSFWSLKDIFKTYGTGLITSKDSLAIQFSKEAMLHVLKDFSSLDPEIARRKYHLGPDTENWKVISAQKDISTHGISENLISTIVYRPFDIRYTYFTGKANGFHGRPKTISHSLFHRDNIALISARTNKTRNIDHFFVSATLTEAKCGESSTQSYVFPMKIASNDLLSDNINSSFIQYLEENLSITSSKTNEQKSFLSKENILSYIYAIFYSTKYRSKYKNFFMYDFPRIPIVKEISLFKELVTFGHQLLTYHLMDFDISLKDFTEFNLVNEGLITKVSFIDNKIFINKEDFFYPVNESIYNFTIGNYKVLYKWLIARKQFKISNEMVFEFNKIIFAIQKTLEIMKEIDSLDLEI